MQFECIEEHNFFQEFQIISDFFSQMFSHPWSIILHSEWSIFTKLIRAHDTQKQKICKEKIYAQKYVQIALHNEICSCM